MKKKNMLNYMLENSKDLEYVVSIETYYEKNKLKVKKLEMKDVNKLSNYLHNLNNNLKIGILLENSNNFVAAFYAIVLNNIIPVSINNAIQIDELNDIIIKNKLDTIITSNTFINLVKESNINNIINIDTINYNNENNLLDFHPFEKKLNDVFVISYTSGTSGSFSKGVELTYRNITFVSEEYTKVYNLNNNSKIITVLPLWHNYAMFACLTSSIVSKSTLVLMNKWDANLFLDINKQIKPDVFPGSPYMYIDLITNHNNELTSLNNLRVCDSGGDSLPIECINKFEKITGAIITEGYGLTETSSLTHFNYNATERKVGSLGKVVSNTECKILDMDGNEVPNGEWGLLWIKGPMVFKDYVGLPKMKEKVKKNGWFNTNDVVKRDDNGFYYIAGRLTDLVQLNQDDSQLRKLENELYKFEGISRVHIKTNYNTIANFYYFDIIAILKNNWKVEDLYDYINSNLKQFVIGEIKIVDDLPTTGTGKIKRNKIKDLFSFNINNYKKSELFGGLRCKTYLLDDANNKYIYQEYYDNTKYQAQKKYNVTNLIKMQDKDILIPFAYKYGNDDSKTWLLTEYKEGEMLSKLRSKGFSLNDISNDIALTLYKIHSTVINSDYGWITDKDVISYRKFSEYLESELTRFKEAVEGNISDSDFHYMISTAENVINKIKKLDSKLHPQLLWFDLNPNNILLKKYNGKYKLSAIIDAGGAKYGIKEWDLAFLKMEVCSNDEEFLSIISEYIKYDNSVNLKLIDYLTVFIELDDMIIRILDKEVLPIPYSSNFENIIKNLTI